LRTHDERLHGACALKYVRKSLRAVVQGTLPRLTAMPMRAPSELVISPHERFAAGMDLAQAV
jgi:hypothetical protein